MDGWRTFEDVSLEISQFYETRKPIDIKSLKNSEHLKRETGREPHQETR